MNMRALYRTHVFFGESFGIESIWRGVCSGVSEHVSDTGTTTVQSHGALGRRVDARSDSATQIRSRTMWRTISLKLSTPHPDSMMPSRR